MNLRSFTPSALIPLLVCSTALAEEPPDGGDEDGGAKQGEPELPTAAILVEPALAIFGFFEGDVDVTIDDTVAVGVWGQYFDYTLFDVGVSGYGVGVGAPIFFTGTVHRGAYVYPLFKLQRVVFEYETEPTAEVTFYGPQVTAGYQWSWGNPVAFTLRVGGGLEYTFGKASAVDQDVSFEGIDYELDAAIGLTF